MCIRDSYRTLAGAQQLGCAKVVFCLYYTVSRVSQGGAGSDFWAFSGTQGAFMCTGGLLWTYEPLWVADAVWFISVLRNYHKTTYNSWPLPAVSNLPPSIQLPPSPQNICIYTHAARTYYVIIILKRSTYLWYFVFRFVEFVSAPLLLFLQCRLCFPPNVFKPSRVYDALW